MLNVGQMGYIFHVHGRVECRFKLHMQFIQTQLHIN